MERRVPLLGSHSWYNCPTPQPCSLICFAGTPAPVRLYRGSEPSISGLSRDEESPSQALAVLFDLPRTWIPLLSNFSIFISEPVRSEAEP